MTSIDIRILDPRLHDWGQPAYHTAMAAGIDLRACLDDALSLAPRAEAVLIRSGIAVSMPSPDMAAFLTSRSGLGHKGLVVSQGVGTIDADYHAEILISVWNRAPDGNPICIQPGDRIAQLVFLPIIRPTLKIVTAFSTMSDRGGFGSTGR